MPLYKRFFTLLSTSMLSLFLIPVQGFSVTPKNLSSNDNLSIWPKAEKKFKRMVITLPSLSNEKTSRIELVPEKIIPVDCNTTILHGNMETKNLQGWGYDYYILNDISLPISTQMACPEQQKKQPKPVEIITNLSFLPYNSKLPIVVYIPKNTQLSYRIWTASPAQTAKEQ